jgi:hypothetical protein
MDLIKNLLESQTVYCQMIIGLKKLMWGVWDETVFVYPTQFSKLHQEKMCHVPDAAQVSYKSQHYNRQLLSRSQKFGVKLCLLYRGLEL